MRRFLIRFFNDRNKETRISTRQERMEFDIFYKDNVSGGIRKVTLALETQGRCLFGFVRNEERQCEGFSMVGTEAQKLNIVK